jgi:hypothetical protein
LTIPYRYAIAKVTLPLSAFIPFGFAGFCYAFRQGCPTEKTDSSHHCLFFFGVKRVLTQETFQDSDCFLLFHNADSLSQVKAHNKGST